MKLVKIKRSDGVDVKAAFSWLVQLLLAELHLPTDLSLNFCGENPGINLISSLGMKFIVFSLMTVSCGHHTGTPKNQLFLTYNSLGPWVTYSPLKFNFLI